MKKYIDILKNNPLFENFAPDDIFKILPCVEGMLSTYKSGDPVILAGDKVTKIGIVLEGVLNISNTYEDGNTGLIGKVSEGGIFGEAFLVSNIYSKVEVYAGANATILFMRYGKIISSCNSACVFHTGLINNLVRVLASKLLQAQMKLGIMHKSSIRGKLEAYFEMRMKESGTNEFTVPFSRGELSEYIGANRSAMYRELKKMEDEGVLKISGRKFTLL